MAYLTFSISVALFDCALIASENLRLGTEILVKQEDESELLSCSSSHKLHKETFKTPKATIQ